MKTSRFFIPLLAAALCLAPMSGFARSNRDGGRGDRSWGARGGDRNWGRHDNHRGSWSGGRSWGSSRSWGSHRHGHSWGRSYYRPSYRYSYGYPYSYGYGYGYPYYSYGYPYYYPRSTFAVSYVSRPSYDYYDSRVYRGRVVDDYADSLALDVQRELRRRGFYRGSLDGDIGPASRAAIRAYQAQRGLRVTGRIDSSLLRALGIG